MFAQKPVGMLIEIIVQKEYNLETGNPSDS